MQEAVTIPNVDVAPSLMDEVARGFRGAVSRKLHWIIGDGYFRYY